MAAGDAIFHFAFIQYTAATVDHHFIGRNIIREFDAGSEFKHRFLSSILPDPFRHLAGPDIPALAVVRTTLCDQDTVVVLNGRKCSHTFKLCFQFTFIS